MRFILGLLLGFALVMTGIKAADAALICGNDDYAEHAVWYVGQDPNLIKVVSSAGDFSTAPVFCEATGAELAYIQKNFTGIKGRKNSGVVSYRGDDATFIIENL